jgi:uncharacterized protein YcbK (DUF882 family)
LFTKKINRRTFLQLAAASAAALSVGKTSFAKSLLPDTGALTLFNYHTNDRLSVNLRRPDGSYDLDALQAVNWIMRCHYTNQVTIMDIDAIEYLNLVDKKLGGGHEIHIISGYRSPTFNSLLVKNGRHVARHSLHPLGKAIDIAIPGIPLDKIRHTAVTLQLGGVGYYPGAGFVHIDSGTIRTW